MNIESLLCSSKGVIKDVMLCINRNTKGIAFITNENKKLVGVMTDGDVRRLLLDGYGLNEPIEEHFNREFTYALSTDKPEEILKRFDRRVRIIPLVDSNMQIVDYAEYDKDMHISLAQPQLIGNEYCYLMDAFLSTWISSTGKYIGKFEESFADYCGVKYGVATSNGTTALHLALLALGIGQGDEVIVPDITFAATINAVLYVGATPVIVDIEEDGWCIDPDKIEKAITSKTKAIIPVHIYGQACDMGRICALAQKYHLAIVEDCAEAHGAEWNGQKVGSFSDIACFSFFGNKVITTGEGGMCITNDSKLCEKMRVYRDHGMNKERRYYHDVIGYNYRMTNLQAAIGAAQVERIDEILDWRERLEGQYRCALESVEGVVLQRNDLPNRKKITWLVSILVDEGRRDQILDKLKENGIDTRAFFIPLSEMEIYKQYAVDCVISKKIAKMGLNLPTTADVSQDIVQKIVKIIAE